MLKERAAQARQGGDLSTAAKHLQQALAANPDDAATNNNVGEVLAMTGRMDLAIDCFRNALRVTPEFIEAHRNLGKALFLRGDQAEKIHSFRRAVHLAPDDAESRFLLGAALRRGGAIHEAVQCLKICIGLEEQLPDPYYHLGLALKGLGRRSDAARAFADAVRLDPGNGFFLAAAASLEADAAGQAKVGASRTAKRIGLYLNQKFHYPILRPLFDALAADHWPLFSADAKELAEFGPSVLIACDVAAREIKSCAPRRPIVYVREGLASKNRAFPLANAADYACVTSEAERDSLIRAGLSPDRLWATGHLQTDALFKREARPVPIPLPPGRRTVPYAPTYEPMMSSAPMLGNRLAELIRGKRDDMTIVIRPHPLACEHQKAWMAAWRQLALSEPHIVLAGEAGANLVPYLQAADVLVSDCSSAAFMYLAVDRPIILITNPEHARDRTNYDPAGIEWRLRGIGEEILDVGLLAQAVDRAIADPGMGAEQRARYRSMVFGDLTDGRAAERIAEKVSALEVRV